jgi:hypothetical protein
MLELLLYCHTIANLKYAGHIAAAMDFIGSAKTRCSRLLVAVVYSREQPVSKQPVSKQPVSMFDCWTERELARSLDRLGAYVASVA